MMCMCLKKLEKNGKGEMQFAEMSIYIDEYIYRLYLEPSSFRETR